MSTQKPSVKLACLCEKVLTEKDGVQTLIRVVDQFSIRPVPPKVLEASSPQIELTLVVALSSHGMVTGKHDLGVQVFGPTKAAGDVQHLEVEFQPGWTAGVSLVATVQVAVVKNFGDCRIEVSFDGELLTVIPFTLSEAPGPSDSAPAATPNQ